MIFDATPCDLGEGPLWHPGRNQLFWFDILNARLHTPGRHWQFSELVSAAGWIDRDRLLIASESRLSRFDLDTGADETLCPLEADTPATRSNDGRADPQGGFWIGTMGKAAEPGAGAIWRWYRGELRRLFPGLTIPNAICFPPDGRSARFTDTRTRRVMRVALDAEGWPLGAPQVFLDLTAEGLNPDGAVIDESGVMWLAQWGAGRGAAGGGPGAVGRAGDVAPPHTSCPAFGGPDRTTLYCTSARQGMDAAALARHPDSGKTFAVAGIARGQSEHRVML